MRKIEVRTKQEIEPIDLSKDPHALNRKRGVKKDSQQKDNLILRMYRRIFKTK